MGDTQRGNMYRWHFDNSECEAIVYAENKKDASEKVREIFPEDWIDFKIIGAEEILSLEEKFA